MRTTEGRDHPRPGSATVGGRRWRVGRRENGSSPAPPPGRCRPQSTFDPPDPTSNARGRVVDSPNARGRVVDSPIVNQTTAAAASSRRAGCAKTIRRQRCRNRPTNMSCPWSGSARSKARPCRRFAGRWRRQRKDARLLQEKTPASRRRFLAKPSAAKQAPRLPRPGSARCAWPRTSPRRRGARAHSTARPLGAGPILPSSSRRVRRRPPPTGARAPPRAIA